MMRKLAALTISLAMLAGLAACASASDGLPKPSSIKTEDEVPRMTVAEVAAEIEDGAVIVVDVRSAGAFAAAHMTGSINIPTDEIADRAGELPKDGLIVTVCT
jgi:3-mercaptopyruvate sulfurtransferase SseA